MTKKWDGVERRHPQPNGREGRRPSDQHCSQHEILWTHHDQDKEKYRGQTCGKITALNAEIDKMVSWKVFAFLFAFSVLVVGSGFGFFGAALTKSTEKHQASMERLEATTSGMAATQAVMMVKITEIEKRQDILRDQNLKILQEKK